MGLIYFSFFLLLSTPIWISVVTERISTKLGHIFTYDCYLKNLVRSPPGVCPPQVGAFWEQKYVSGTNFKLWPKYLCSGTWYQQSERNSPTCFQIWWTLTNKRLKTVGEFLPIPLKFTSCELTFAIHFGLIIFARWHLWSTQMPRAWLALMRLPAAWAHAGLCHASILRSVMHSLASWQCLVCSRLCVSVAFGGNKINVNY